MAPFIFALTFFPLKSQNTETVFLRSDIMDRKNAKISMSDLCHLNSLKNEKERVLHLIFHFLLMDRRQEAQCVFDNNTTAWINPLTTQLLHAYWWMLNAAQPACYPNLDSSFGLDCPISFVLGS